MYMYIYIYISIYIYYIYVYINTYTIYIYVYIFPRPVNRDSLRTAPTPRAQRWRRRWPSQFGRPHPQAPQLQTRPISCLSAVGYDKKSGMLVTQFFGLGK